MKTLNEHMKEAAKEYFVQLLQEYPVRSEAAEVAGISQHAMYRYLRVFGLFKYKTQSLATYANARRKNFLRKTFQCRGV